MANGPNVAALNITDLSRVRIAAAIEISTKIEVAMLRPGDSYCLMKNRSTRRHSGGRSGLRNESTRAMYSPWTRIALTYGPSSPVAWMADAYETPTTAVPISAANP